MSSTSIKLLALPTALIAALGLALPTAAHAKFLSQSDSVEAEHIEVTLNGDGTGVAVIKGCPACPLELRIDTDTKLLHKREHVRAHKLKDVSGGPGTVIYDSKTARVIRIRW